MNAGAAPTSRIDPYGGGLRAAGGDRALRRFAPYPPGIPAVAPGELYTDENVSYLEALVEAGGFVEGASDPTLERLRVVAE